MRLQRLTLQDFRPFLGTHTLEFATGREGNVTVVYGATGAGKTTLLNAFTWVLYGTFTDDFEQQDRLVNNQLMATASPGESRAASVALEFEHENCRYFLKRTVTERQTAQGARERVGNPEVVLSYTDEGGRNYTQRNPDDAIDRILPERLHQFFLFNGERIEHLVDPSAYEEIEQAIKTLLGLEVIERSLRHLPQVRRTLEEELRQVGTPEIARLTGRLEELENQLGRLEEDHAQQRRNLAALDTELETLDAELRTFEEVRPLQEARDRAEGEARETEQRLRRLRDQIAATINDRGFVAFTAGLCQRAAELFGDLRTRREIPAPMKRQFVDDLLHDQVCICGTELTPGTPAHEHVVSWRKRVGLADVEEAWTRVSAQAEQFGVDRESLTRDLDGLVGDLAAARARRSGLEEELSEISRKIEKFPEQEQIPKLESRRQKVLNDRDTAQRQLGVLEERIAATNRGITQARQALDRAQTQSAKEATAKRRVRVTSQAANLLKKVLDLRTQDVREELDRRIRDVYSAITYKPYRPELTEEFRLTLREGDGLQPVAKSTGENQILSLSFVGALAALARERHDEAAKAKGLLGLFSAAGGIFPIVMDAPFGTLDETPRREVARGLPTLAPQVVIFVSKAQGVGAVEEELRPRIGSSWVIHYLSPKEGAVPEALELQTHIHPYVDPSSDGVERAELLEVRS